MKKALILGIFFVPLTFTENKVILVGLSHSGIEVVAETLREIIKNSTTHHRQVEFCNLETKTWDQLDPDPTDTTIVMIRDPRMRLLFFLFDNVFKQAKALNKSLPSLLHELTENYQETMQKYFYPNYDKHKTISEVYEGYQLAKTANVPAVKCDKIWDNEVYAILLKILNIHSIGKKKLKEILDHASANNKTLWTWDYQTPLDFSHPRWKRYLTGKTKELFKQKMGNFLIDFNYEHNYDW